MTPEDATRLCGEAIKLQIAGRLDLAEPLYRQVLGAEPRHPIANHCVGMLLVQQQQPAAGLPHLLAALEVNPERADYWLGYLEALLLLGSFDTAKATLALARERGLTGSAVEHYAQRLFAALPVQVAPATPASRAARRREEAQARKQEAALLDSIKRRRFDTAATLAGELTARHPDRGLGWKVQGALQWAQKRGDEAIHSMQTAVRLLPEDAEAHCNLATTLVKANRFSEAQTLLARAIELAPNSPDAHVHLCDALQIQGRYAEAEAHIRRAIALSADKKEADAEMIHSTLLFILSHDPAVDAATLFAEHRRVGEHFEAPWRQHLRRHANDPSPARTLRVGIVSGDFYDHAVATFIEPMLARLSLSEGLTLHAYYNNDVDDKVTQRLRGYFKSWTSVSQVPNAKVIAAIKADRIDVLIDLAGHTAQNRLKVFAAKPAPIQISWIGYPGTTGLTTMDYFLADPHFLPPGRFDAQFTEKLVHLPAQTPFQPHASAPPVNALPAHTRGHLTFGSFNRLGKINDSTVELWSQLLCRLPDTRLLLAGMPGGKDDRALIERFVQRGVAADRLELHARADMHTYLSLYHRIDLCLDTTPYNGGTTTIHALWMGVPTLSLAGPTPAARSGAAILGQMGLNEFVADSRAEFLEKGVYWSTHLAQLGALRATLRERWAGSTERGAAAVAAAFESALRRMWQRWCAELPPESFQVA
jgi:predicted O-linked N-acetylglucosamine transferase (SPINDLY family)